jgi:succinate-semialdehyde dehydrogenase/glutarate-semialdehyde dehydrogenase
MIAKMRNGGAACTAANRFYVHTQVLDEFTSKFVKRMSALVVGDGMAEATTLGPLVSAAQQSRVSSLVERAISEGATALCGASATPAPMHGYAATVLVGVQQHHSIVQQEVFGPVAPIIEVQDIEESIPLFNGVDHGLVSYIYTSNHGRGMRLAHALETGMVGLNRGLVSDPAAPFGGVKQSGLGREGGHDGLLAFMETKYVSTDW